MEGLLQASTIILLMICTDYICIGVSMINKTDGVKQADRMILPNRTDFVLVPLSQDRAGTWVGAPKGVLDRNTADEGP